MRRSIETNAESYIGEAFLRATRFCDVPDPDITRLALALQRGTRRDSAVAVFGYVRDEIAYEVGNWQRTASQTLRRGRGTCTNAANLMVAILRCLGIPAGYGVMTVDGRQYFGPAIPRRLCSRVSHRSRHVYVCVRLDDRWVRCDPSDDAAFAIGSQHVNPQSTLIDWDGDDDALLWLDPAHIIEDLHPLADIDLLMAKPMRTAMRFPVHVGNFWIQFMREHGASATDATDCQVRFERWLTRRHPVTALGYRTLPVRPRRTLSGSPTESVLQH